MSTCKSCCSGEDVDKSQTKLSQQFNVVETKVLHPLEPLAPHEIILAVSLTKAKKSSVDFVNVVLHEPHKDDVMSWKEGEPFERRAFLQVHDRKEEKSYEVIINLIKKSVELFEHIPNIQPPFVSQEYSAIQKMLAENAEFKKALLKRGITDPTKITCELWSVGWFSKEDDPNRRLAWVLCYYKNDEHCEEFNYPIEGLCPLVDLNKSELIRIDDFRVAKLPKNDSGYFGDQYKVLKTPSTQLPLKKLKVIQPDGPSFVLDGYKLRWHFWEMRLGFTPREGLVLHQVGIHDDNKFRPILYRASISEMVVPYGSPHPPHFRKNAFDVSEDGMGTNLNKLNAGCDCIGSPQFLDAHMADEFGKLVTIKNAICIHEEDGGILWKHTNWKTGKSSMRRSRRLVISTFTTVSNYDYGFRWYFDLDGSMEFEMLLTGIISVRILRGGDKDYGTNVDKNPYISGTYHQHFVSLRLHTMVDGEKNSVVEVNSEGLPPSEMNPYGNAFMATKTLLRTESEAQRIINPLKGRSWSIVNPNKNNKMGYPVAYKLEPGDNVLPMAQPDSFIIRRCPFISKHLWVTKYHPDEKFPAGDYPSQQPSELDGITEWTKKNRKVDNEDIVVWYNFGAHHLPRPEDWPIMPQSKIGFKLRPNGFFDKNPTLNLPPPECEIPQSKL